MSGDKCVRSSIFLSIKASNLNEKMNFENEKSSPAMLNIGKIIPHK